MSMQSDIHVTPVRRDIPEGGLLALDTVTLSRRHERMLAAAMRPCGGPAFWRLRKQREARDFLALAQVCGRLAVHELRLGEAFQAVAYMEVPVPCRPDETGRLRIAGGALIGLTYREEAVRLPAPGYAFANILAPHDVWHANVGGAEHGQPICLGQSMPAAIPLRELVLLIYGALSLQTVMIDERDVAGVMSADAARWWQQNLHRIPLTREPFIRPIEKGPAQEEARP